ncbi:hypothetical protein CEV34_3034 [Brucella pseudogrignonensis]|uniref:Uncharacterized protein n=1 Tax=Brucella pseudogrignonensis TaxID=419475 RepID=A0A256GDR2_9HYPH|nr:hypothetical protein CEV34_3034 [Brucella pseudogrignonensis]
MCKARLNLANAGEMGLKTTSRSSVLRFAAAIGLVVDFHAE